MMQVSEEIKSYPLLLIGAEWPTEFFTALNASLKLNQKPIFIKKISYEDFFENPSVYRDLEKCEIILVMEDQKFSVNFFDEIKNINNKMEVYYFFKSDVINFSKIINDWNVKKLYNFKTLNKNGEVLIKELEILLDKRIERKELVKKTFQQQKMLDKLVGQQEIVVYEKTLDIEKSNKDEDLKLKKERTLLRFLKDISNIENIFDLLIFLKNEFKVFHQIGEVFFFTLIDGQNLKFLRARISDNWKKIQLIHGVDLLADLSKNNSNYSELWANLFARPFGKLMSFKLSQGTFFAIENQFKEIATEEFEEFLNDRLEIIKMAFDKLTTEENVQEFSYRWEKTFDAISEPVAIIDKNYNLLRSNAAFEQRTLSLKCYEVFAQLSSPCPSCPLEEVILTGKETKKDLIINKKNYELFSYPMKSNSQIKSVIHSYHDRSEDKKLYSKLIQTEKLKSIGNLAGHLAHELNNPLTGIRTMVQALQKEEKMNDSQLSDLREIEKTVERCFKVINNFIDFTQPKDRTSKLVDIDELVEKTLPLLKVALRDHQLVLDLKNGKKNLNVDEHLFQHIVFNLVSNAIQAIAIKEKGKITISTELKNAKIMLKIADTGVGIPKENQNLIFEPFFTTKAVGQGTGIGLNIVKNIVEGYGGTIGFSSVVGVGTEFYLEWPVSV